jgi:type IV secretory pathway VirB6-like protein
MDIPLYSSVIIRLIAKIDLVTQGFVSSGFQSLANYLEKPAALAATLMIVLVGYGMLHGLIDMSIKTFNRLALTLGAVYTLAFSWVEFNAYFINFFLHAANDVAGVMVQGKLFSFPFLPGTGQGLNAALQTVLIEAVKVGGWVMSKGGFTDWIPYFIGLSFMLGGTVVVALAAIELIVVKLYLAMLMAVAPFFICCLMFPQTKGQFDGWLAQIKGFSIALILLGVGVGLCMYLMHWVVGGYYVQQAVGIKIYSVVPLVIASLLCIILLIGIIPIAKQIGGVHGGSGWAAVGGALGGMTGSLVGSGMKGMQGTKAILGAQGKMTGKLGQAARQTVLPMASQSRQSASSIYSRIRNHSQQGH